MWSESIQMWKWQMYSKSTGGTRHPMILVWIALRDQVFRLVKWRWGGYGRFSVEMLWSLSRYYKSGSNFATWNCTSSLTFCAIIAISTPPIQFSATRTATAWAGQTSIIALQNVTAPLLARMANVCSAKTIGVMDSKTAETARTKKIVERYVY